MKFSVAIWIHWHKNTRQWNIIRKNRLTSCRSHWSATKMESFRNQKPGLCIVSWCVNSLLSGHGSCKGSFFSVHRSLAINSPRATVKRVSVHVYIPRKIYRLQNLVLCRTSSSILTDFLLEWPSVCYWSSWQANLLSYMAYAMMEHLFNSTMIIQRSSTTANY